MNPKNKFLRLLGVATLACGLTVVSGCAATGSSQDDAPVRIAPQDADLVKESHKAADKLLEATPWLKENNSPLLYGSFVNVSAIEDSSSFGRIVAEQIGSRFAQQGFNVMEMKLRNNVYIRDTGEEGEFVLSRSVRELAQNYNASAIIAGTYAVGRRSVYVSARLVRATDNRILASYDYNLPMGPDTKALLAGQ